MLGKLLKYEIKACGRTFIPIYIAILVMSFANAIFINTQMFDVSVISSFVLVGLFISLGVLTIVLIIQRFKKNLLEDEGYLMFTLPVNTRSLVLSKLISSIIYVFLSGIVALISFQIIALIMASQIVGGNNIPLILEGYNSIFKFVFSDDNWKGILWILLLFLISYSSFILTIYTSISMGQLPKLNKHRNIAAFVAFFIINIIVSSVQDIVVNMTGVSYENLPIGDGGVLTLGTSYGVIGFDIMIVIILFIATTYILDKKLNLE